MSGKGSRRRNPQVAMSTVSDNWDRIFNTDSSEKTTESTISYMAGKNICDVWDSGWCYHPDAVGNTACPGVSRCNIIIEL